MYSLWHSNKAIAFDYNRKYPISEILFVKEIVKSLGKILTENADVSSAKLFK